MEDNDARLLQRLLQAQTMYGKSQRTEIELYGDFLDYLDELRTHTELPEDVKLLAGEAEVALLRLHVAIMKHMKEGVDDNETPR